MSVRPRGAPSFVTVGEAMVDVEAAGRGHDARVTVSPGGSAVNAAAWASSLGAQCAVVARIGSDAGGRMVRGAIAELGIAPLLTEDDDEPTGAFLLVEDDPGDRRVFADRGANARFSPDDVPDPLAGDAVLVSGYLLLHRGSASGARAALAAADAPLVAVDAASAELVAACGRDRFLELTAGASALLANEAEAAVLTGATAADAARALGERFRLACVKRGANGAVAVHDGELATAAPPAVEPRETVGAGDAFAAGLLVALAGGASLAVALREACRCGALAARQRWPSPAGGVFN